MAGAEHCGGAVGGRLHIKKIHSFYNKGISQHDFLKYDYILGKILKTMKLRVGFVKSTGSMSEIQIVPKY